MSSRPTERSSATFVLYWLPLLLYLAVIFTLSAQPRLKPPLDFQSSDKMYHVLEYVGLGVLLARLIARVRPSWKPAIAGLAAIAVGVGIAIIDELFQRTVPGRISSVYDVLADSIGLALGAFLFGRWHAGRKE